MVFILWSIIKGKNVALKYEFGILGLNSAKRGANILEMIPYANVFHRLLGLSVTVKPRIASRTCLPLEDFIKIG